MNPTLKSLSAIKDFDRVAIIGIGNEQDGDDAAGIIAARLLDAAPGKNSNLLIIEAGMYPENQTGVLRRFKPDLILFIDAAQIDETPGAYRLIELADITGISASSHSLPLTVLCHFLVAELNCDIKLLGIQPAQLTLLAPLSQPVSQAITEITDALTALLD